MKNVRGYGSSIVTHTNEEAKSLKTRDLQTTDRNGNKSIVSFRAHAQISDSFIMALWISVIDKIISKPSEENKKTKPDEAAKNVTAKTLRQRIGDAVLSGKMVRGHRLESAQWWDWKIKAKTVSKQEKDIFPKGRWYAAFLGNTDPQSISDAQINELVHDIDRHIYQVSRNYKADTAKSGSEGLLEDMLAAIEKNTLKTAYEKQFPEGKKQECTFDKTDWEKYCEKANKVEGGDFAKGVREAALKSTNPKAEVKPYYQAVEYLKNDIWEKVFGKNVGRKEAQETEPQLLAVHDAVREFYKNTLKGRKTILAWNVAAKIGAKGKESDKKIEAETKKKLEYILPSSANKLKWLLCKKDENIDVNHYIRLGKILHYEASRTGNAKKAHDQDSTIAIIGHWADARKNLPNSFYWSSEGQTYIKQNEAFIRVWRRALAFANRSLKDWADPEHKVRGDAAIGDTWKDIRKEYGWSAEPKDQNPDKAKSYFEGAFVQHYELLFGKKWEGENQTEILNFLQKRLRDMRGSVFHFKGMKKFIDELKSEAESSPPHMEDFYKADCIKYRQKPIAIMRGAKFEQYFKCEQIEQILQEVRKHDAVSVALKDDKIQEVDDGQALPLPTLKRVLKRVKTAWEKESALPSYDAAAKKNEKANEKDSTAESAEDKKRREEEAKKEAAKHAQYIALKMLYEKPFRAWLANLEANQINGFIDKAVKRATDGAQNLTKEKEFKELIKARAAALPRLAQGERIDRFFFNLTAATASEMRVQKDYKSDGEKAREQAEYIEDLKCDVIALALEKYLQKPAAGESKEDFSYLAKGKESLKELLENNIDWEELKKKLTNDSEKTIDNSKRTFEPWLYFLLHLIPVEEIGSLRQQIRKWQIAVGKTEINDEEKDKARIDAAKVRPLLQVLDLYIELHDEQFNTGKDESCATEKQKQLDLSDDDKKQLEKYYDGDFEIVFSEQMQKEKLQAVRGLRELRRFGNKVLDTILQEVKVDSKAVQTWKNETDKNSPDYGKVAKAQNTRKTLHEEWVKAKGQVGKDWWYTTGKGKDTKYFLGKTGKEYVRDLKTIIKHQQAVAQVELQNHLHLHKLLMQVLGRLVDFSGLFERDLYFTMLALFYKEKVEKLEEQFTDTKSIAITEIAKSQEQLIGSLLEQGRTPEAFAEKLHEGKVKERLKDIFKLTGIQGEGKTKQEKQDDLANKDVHMWIRNRFAHLAVLEGMHSSENKEPIFDVDLTREMNFARALMSYDRKLKNAVAQSIKEMLKRNKLEISWQMGKGGTTEPNAPHVKIAYESIKATSKHYLHGAKVKSREIYHLKQKGVFWEKGQPDKNRGKAFQENLQSDEFISMVQMLFGGSNKTRKNKPSVQVSRQPRPRLHNGKKNRHSQKF